MVANFMTLVPHPQQSFAYMIIFNMFPNAKKCGLAGIFSKHIKDLECGALWRIIDCESNHVVLRGDTKQNTL